MRYVLGFVIFLLMLTCEPAKASTPHYLNGIVGIDAAVMPGPGWYFESLNSYYSTNSIRNNKGKEIDVNFSFDTFVTMERLLWVSDFKILGGRFGADIIVPFAYLDVSIGKTIYDLPDIFNVSSIHLGKDSSSGGLSDIYVDPLLLSWSKDRYDFSLSMGVFMPTGRYDPRNPASPGRGFWTFMPSMGATVYLDCKKSWSASVMAHYEIHTEQKKTHKTAGDHFHFDWGVGKRFAKYWQFGAAGYCSWQVTEDKGPQASKLKYRTFAAGPELNVAIPKYKAQIGIRSLWEFESRNSSQGNITTLTFTLSF